MKQEYDTSPETVARLHKRLTTVSQEKSRLQFVSNLLSDMAGVRGVENMVHHAIFTIMDAIGGVNVGLYYTVGDKWFYSDVYQEITPISEIENERVTRAMSRKCIVESSPRIFFDDKKSQGIEDYSCASDTVWVFPLIAGDEVIGALEMAGIFFEYSNEIKKELQIVINYFSLALSNEITNSGNLKAAYDALKWESRKLEREVAERKAAEQEKIKFEAKLRQAQKMEAMGTLAGGIAHDFNNILFPLIGYTEMLQEDFPQEPVLQDRVGEILKAAFRARDLVRQILTFSRQSPQSQQPVHIQSIVGECLKLLEASIPRTIHIKTRLHAAGEQVLADPTEMHQIVMNLATNAYHAMQSTGGTLTVSMRPIELDTGSKTVATFTGAASGKYVLLKVIDTGHGIDKTVMDKIFDPYFTTKPKDRGTGLGLAVVQGIVKKCKGGVHVYSEPGRGTEIHVYLPLMEKKEERNAHAPSRELQKGTERILLVDDETAVLKMEQMMLERLGYRVTSINKSPAALEIFNAHPEDFDLVITDMTMPDMTGDRLAVAVNRIRPEIPVLLCTGFSENMSKQKAQSLGISGFLLKPVQMKTLAGKVREVLNRFCP